MRLQQHRAIFGCPFSFPLFLSPLPPSSLLGPHILRMEEMRGIKKGKLGHITAQGCLLCLCLSCSPSFLCLSIFLPSFSLLLHLLTFSFFITFPFSQISVLCGTLHFLWFLPSSVFSRSHVGLTERDRKRWRERNDLVEEGMSLHAVTGYYFSSSALLFFLSPPHYLHPSEPPQQSLLSALCVLSICVCWCWCFNLVTTIQAHLCCNRVNRVW